MNVLVFDIETIPDTSAGKRIYDLDGLSDDDVAKSMYAKRIQKTGGSDFLALHLHKVVAISAVFRSQGKLKVWSLGETDSTEGELIHRFFDGIDRFSPTIVSWNGSGFDLPVLHYRSMVNDVVAPRYWESGEEDRDFKFNNYLNRFHSRHIDLMDVLAAYNLRAAAPLDEVAVMLGFPGKLGMSGALVWEKYQEGGIEEIRNYCETDVLNTYLVFLKWEVVRGNLSPSQFEKEMQLLKDFLEEENKPHFTEFLQAWQSI